MSEPEEQHKQDEHDEFRHQREYEQKLHSKITDIKFDKYPPELFESLTIPSEKATTFTLPQLITKLTSPTSLDYSLLADFFLSYRTFTTSLDVYELLFARLTWALRYHERQLQGSGTKNETGRDIVVRSFVVLRHWILNFFGDDFVTNIELRQKLANAVNYLYKLPVCQQDETIKRVFHQLKRCWNKECSIYWNVTALHDDDSSSSHQSGEEEGEGEEMIGPGGAFATIELNAAADAEKRRLTVLQYYDGPVDPILQKPPEVLDFTASGSLIRGGISLSNNVEVKSAIPPTPVKVLPANKTTATKEPKKLKPKKSLRNLAGSWRPENNSIFGSVVNALTRKKHSRGNKSELKGTTQEFPEFQDPEVIRIDILSARVIEELDRILKRRADIGQGYDEWDHRDSETTTTTTNGSSRPDSLSTITHKSSVDFSFVSASETSAISDTEEETSPELESSSEGGDSVENGGNENDNEFNDNETAYENYEKNNDINNNDRKENSETYTSNQSDGCELESVPDWTDTIDQTKVKEWTTTTADNSDSTNKSAIHVMKRKKRFSMIDTLGVQELSPLKRSQENSNLVYELDSDNKSNSSNNRFGDIQRVSNGSCISISTGVSLSTGRASYMSYDSDLSECQSIQAPRQKKPSATVEEAFLRRRGIENLRQLAGMGRSESESTMQSSGSSAGTFQHNNSNNNVLIPYSGLDEEMVAKLASIPDDTPDEDAIAAALQRLEGKYERKKGKDRGLLEDDEENEDQEEPAFDDSFLDSNLYNAAFDTAPDLQQLNIPEAPRSSTASTVTQHSSDEAQKSEPGNEQAQKQMKQGHQRSVSRVPEPEEPLSVQSSIQRGNHVPFVLDYGSQLLSEQFTLIERDALAQVDWKELIELTWNGHLEPVQSWLAFLVERNVRGVEVVISRFNLMVNWVKSEILLTWSIDERVRAISRFIHVAHQCRLLQNYSTVMQIVLALAAPVIQELKTTWRRLNPADLKLYRQLEDLVSPLNNFKLLRKELNKMNGERGCIPFVGVYLSDLTNNNEAYGPDSGSPNDKTAINFKRVQVASTIVKGLIQCIQWSKNYRIDCNRDPDLLAKCLYIHSLTVEEMDQCFEFLNEP